MKARPILMHGRSIRSILAGRKTQTRRIVKPQPDGSDFEGPYWYEPLKVDRHGEEYPGDPIYGISSLDGEWGIKCPKGAPGDLLYVRETWRTADGAGNAPGSSIAYRADWPDADSIPIRWTPSIHMPRWASRLTLHLTEVRVERVQEIDPIDCWREGIRIDDGNGKAEPPQIVEVPYLREFRQLWDETNGPGAWDRNDWCWCLGFRVIEANVDDVLADPARYGINTGAAA